MQLTTALTGQFSHAVDRSVNRLNETVAPYTRFVRAEHERLGQGRDDLRQHGDTLARLHTEAERLLR